MNTRVIAQARKVSSPAERAARVVVFIGSRFWPIGQGPTPAKRVLRQNRGRHSSHP
jgi:hypothetical protein